LLYSSYNGNKIDFSFFYLQICLQLK